MLKQLIQDVNFETCRKDYLEKVSRVGQKDAELALLGYHMITPQKIRAFLRRNLEQIVGREVNIHEILDHAYKAPDRQVDLPSYTDWLGSDSVGVYVDTKEERDIFLCLREVNIENYGGFIPENCLDRALSAKDTGMFDRLTVAYPEYHAGPVKDPVIFGRRNSSQNRFFIAQWDNDVTLDDLL